MLVFLYIHSSEFNYDEHKTCRVCLVCAVCGGRL